MDETEILRDRIILITGASGFTGRHACEYFSRLGMQVAALVRDKHKVDKVDRVHYYSCDLLDYSRLSYLVAEIAPDYILHLGGKNSVFESWEMPTVYLQSNLLPTLYLLDAMRTRPDCIMLVVGSRAALELTVFDKVTNPYGLSKSLQKAATLSWRRLFHQKVILAEPSNLIGPGASTGFCSLLGRHVVRTELGKETAPFRISSRAERRDFLDVRDAVRAYGYLLLFGSYGEVYPVCSGIERSLEEITDKMLNVAERNIPLIWGDERASAGASSSERAAEVEGFGWCPQIPLMESLEDIIEYYRATEGVIR
ncbi:NAD-dependent epimerase/dehydratase family protein [Paenibacillus aceti]|uniref:UDP-2-acetamido-2,6-dideoxy-hexulose 4-reductase n=1 Tax=Paenibacillus aceti TaxID=1820010 RepID=A0ABQ1VR28_9BACL|nr:NAD-dependent epimerase/dehydratase family protein [Paenibacillus aceti]GGF89767.1 UDP-2-acetamido-2,6-dideoxy-hexulose 4-reductase [Paenibacillus aceti]